MSAEDKPERHNPHPTLLPEQRGDRKETVGQVDSSVDTRDEYSHERYPYRGGAGVYCSPARFYRKDDSHVAGSYSSPHINIEPSSSTSSAATGSTSSMAGSCYRRKVAAMKSLKWSEVDFNLYNETFAGRVRTVPTYVGASTHHSSNECTCMYAPELPPPGRTTSPSVKG